MSPGRFARAASARRWGRRSWGWMGFLAFCKWNNKRIIPSKKEAQWPIGYGIKLRIKRSSARIRPWPLRWVLGKGSLLPLSQGEAFTLASIIGSAEALPILCVRYFRWEREIQTERERRKWRHHCRAKIGDEFTLSLAKSSHNWRWAYTFPCQNFALFVSPFTLPVSPFAERSPWWRWNSQWVHTFHCQKFFRPQALFPLFQMARAARRVIENPRQMIKSCPILFCSSHRKTESN